MSKVMELKHLDYVHFVFYFAVNKLITVNTQYIFLE